jgi:hypothetical protein
MFRALTVACRFPGLIWERARGIEYRRTALVLLEAFGSAAAASIYGVPSYPRPDHLLEVEPENVREEACKDRPAVERTNTRRHKR